MVSPSAATRLAKIVHRHEARGAFHVLHQKRRRAGNKTHQMLADHARGGVDAAARRKADDHGQRLARIEIGRVRARRATREHDRGGNRYEQASLSQAFR